MYQLFIGRVYAICSRLLTDSHQAEDLSVNIFSQALKEISFIRADSSFATWLTGISVYTVLEKIRSKDKEPGKDKKNADKESSRKFEYIRASNDQALERAISELPDMLRMVFVLHDMVNYTDEETSDLLRIPKPDVEKNLVDARDYLIQNLFMRKDYDELLFRVKKLYEKIEPETNLWPQILPQIHSSQKMEESELKEEMVVQNVGDVVNDKKTKDDKKRKKRSKKKESSKGASSPSHSELFEKFKRVKPKTWASVLIAVVVLIIAVLFFTSSNNWTIKKLKGSPQLGYETITDSKSFNDKLELKTNAESSAEIDIKEIGKIIVSPQTVLKRTHSKDGIILERGIIEVDTRGANKEFSISIPNGEIKSTEPNSIYSVELSSAGLMTLQVKGYSWVNIKSDDNEALVPPGFRCNIIEKLGLGLPYENEASDEYKDALSKFSFSQDKEEALKAIITLSQKQDAVTLWNLLKRVSPTNRIIVFDKLAEFVPPNSNIDKGGIVTLNPDMMKAYLEEIKKQM